MVDSTQSGIENEVGEFGGWVNAYTHLDWAYTISSPDEVVGLSWEERWKILDEIKQGSSTDEIYDRMAYAIEGQISQGVKMLASFIDIDATVRDKALHAALRVREKYKSDITIKYINFTRDHKSQSRKNSWVSVGSQFADIIGIFLNVQDEFKFVEGLFDTATATNKLFHIQLPNQISQKWISLFFSKIKEFGFENRTSLIFGSPLTYSAAIKKLIRETGSTVVLCPTQNFATNGTESIFSNRFCLGTGGISDVFQPFGDGRVWSQLFYLCQRMGGMKKERIVESITLNGRIALGIGLPPPYNIAKTFEENIAYGPFFFDAKPKIEIAKKTFRIFGHEVNSLLGIGAGPLTFGYRNTVFWSTLGYDILTYRSVRSQEWHGLSFPNWRYTDIPFPLKPSDLNRTFIVFDQELKNQELSMVDSFGIQSLKPQFWIEDFERTKNALQKGQLLILALMITPHGNIGVVEDAKTVAHFASQTSAQAFEINLACPNSGSSALVYEDVETSLRVCEAVKSCVGKRPLIAKIGYFKQREILRAFLQRTQGVLDGVASINTISVQTKDNEGNDAFPGRPTSGLSGGAIRDLALAQIKEIVRLKSELHLKDFTILGLGGVLIPEHVQGFLEIGADAVQVVTGAWKNPFLAKEYQEYRRRKNGIQPKGL